MQPLTQGDPAYLCGKGVAASAWASKVRASVGKMIAHFSDFATAAVRGCRWKTTRQRASLRAGEARLLPARGAVEKRPCGGADSGSGCAGSD